MASIIWSTPAAGAENVFSTSQCVDGLYLKQVGYIHGLPYRQTWRLLCSAEEVNWWETLNQLHHGKLCSRPSTPPCQRSLPWGKKKKKSHYVVKLAITNMQNQLDFEIKVAIDYCLHIVLGKSPMNEPPDQAFFSFISIWCGLFDSLVSICMHPHTHVYGSFKSMFCHSGNNTSSLFILNVYITFFFFF